MSHTFFPATPLTLGLATLALSCASQSSSNLPISPEQTGHQPEQSAAPDEERSPQPAAVPGTSSSAELLSQDQGREPEGERSYIGATATTEERLALQALIDESEAVWSSPEFAENLSSLKNKYSATFVATGVKLDASALLDLLRGASGERRVPAAVTLVGGRNYFFALTGATEVGQTASMALGRGNLYINWIVKDEVHRSCGINTMIHEMSHLLFAGEQPVGHRTQLVQDQGAAADSAPNEAVASYLVGTVGQCTWLQKSGRVPADGLQDCIDVFGHRGFNSLRCDKFSNGEQVKPRTGLPSEHIIQ